jgi:molybdopterin synthase catalytic subunit
MQANEIHADEKSAERREPKQIASWAHLVGLLLIGAGVVVLGFLAQHAPSGGGGAAPASLQAIAKLFPST